MFRALILGLTGMAAGLVAVACSGGLSFNGTNNNTVILPRTTPIRPFPLPIEAYDPIEDEFQIDRATLLFGRPNPNPPGPGPEFGHPATGPMPQVPTAFVFKAGTDIWEVTPDADVNGNGQEDIIDLYGGQANAAMAGMISVCCQWLAQQVDGAPRTDTPFTYDNVPIESIPLSVFSANGIDPFVIPPPPPPVTIGAPWAGALSATLNSEQRPVDQRIGIIGQLSPTQDVGTQNPNAALQSVNSPGRSSHVMLSLAGGVITLGSWLESPQENLFIESNWNILVNFPTTYYFNSFAQGTDFGGLHLARVNVPLNPVYDPNIDISFYHAGVLLAHTIGRGTGLPAVSFVRPGVSTRQEDLMQANLLVDIFFYQVMGRRFQHTPESFLIMHNTVAFPIGSQTRADAQQRSQTDPFDPAGTMRRETTPGPKR